MRRQSFLPRPDWREKCEQVGFVWHSVDGRYWDESAAYVFSAAQIDHLEAVTEQLHQLCLQAVDHIIGRGLFASFNLPPATWELITKSWRNGEKGLYGRFDFSWDGTGEPKLLEYNADTPTGLLEASVVQWYWLRDVMPKADQFNSIHEKLLHRWPALFAKSDKPAILHFTSMQGHEEDAGNTLYLMDTACQAGFDVNYLPIDQIGRADGVSSFLDTEDRPISNCFKLYPWEWLYRDEFACYLNEPDATRFIEPAWKVLLSSKAILPYLWKLNPGHPNLLPASFQDDLGRPSVRKPVYSREGENISILLAQSDISTDGLYAGEPVIYQAYAPLPSMAGSFPVIGSWVIGDAAAGIGIREDDGPITRNSSRFVPHYFL
jgi:glutathionylspermidine synthase